MYYIKCVKYFLVVLHHFHPPVITISQISRSKAKELMELILSVRYKLCEISTVTANRYSEISILL